MGFIRAAVASLIVLLPLPFGGVRPYALLALQLAAAALSAACFIQRAATPPLSRPARQLLCCGVGVGLIGLLQLVPLPGAARLGLLPAAAALGSLPAGHELADAPGLDLVSVSPPETTLALLQWTAYVLLGGVALVAFRSQAERRVLERAIVVSAAFQAIYGLAEYLTGSQRIFLYERQYYLDCATGTFINRNHYAAFLAGSMPFVLVAAMRAWAGGAGRLRRWEAVARSVSFGGLLGFLWLAILLSRSRAGLLGALIATAIVILRAQRIRRHTLALGGVVVAATLVLLTIEVVPPAERFFALESDLSADAARPVMWRTTLDGALEFPVLGVGLGTFADWFSVTQPPGFPGRVTHAHSDWLQLAVEGGWIAVGLVAAMLGIAWRAWRSARGESGSSSPSVADAAFAAVCALAAHSAVDFPMRIPAVALLATLALALAVISSGEVARA